MKKKIINLLIATAALSLTAGIVTACGGKSGGKIYEPNTVTFNYNDNGSRPYKAIVTEGEPLSAPADPVRAGYTFKGWTTDEAGTTKATFPLTPQGGEVFYASWDAAEFTVTLDYNCQDPSTTKTITKKYGEKITESDFPLDEPTHPIAGYEHNGWQLSLDNDKKVNFPYTVKKDFTLYAHWAITYSVSFDYNFGSSYDATYDKELQDNPITTVKLDKGKGTALNTKLSRPGYNFIGWSKNQNATTEAECEEKAFTPTENTNLYAVWQLKECQVKFCENKFDGTKAMFSSAGINGVMKVNGRTKISDPGAPTRAGYEFMGWYTGQIIGTGEKVTFPNTILNHATYYAQWKKTAVTTDTFDAELTEIDPNLGLPGYSGGSTGTGIIVHSDSASCVNNGESLPENYGNMVSYQYAKDTATVTFKINSDKAVTGATLSASLAIEILDPLSCKFSSGGGNGQDNLAYKIYINDTDMSYTPIEFSNEKNIGTGQTQSEFKSFTLGNINLKAGENVIKFVVKNDAKIGGGTMQAFGPMIDSITISNHGDATLSWNPVYDNLRKADVY